MRVHPTIRHRLRLRKERTGHYSQIKKQTCMRSNAEAMVEAGVRQ